MNGFKPCPFCGSIDIRYSEYEISGEKEIVCEECPVTLFFDVDLSKEEIKALWNQRKEPKENER